MLTANTPIANIVMPVRFHDRRARPRGPMRPRGVAFLPTTTAAHHRGRAAPTGDVLRDRSIGVTADIVTIRVR